MAERDGAAVDVDPFGVELGSRHGQRLNGERFIQLEQVDVAVARPARSSARRTAGTGPMPAIQVTPAVRAPGCVREDARRVPLPSWLMSRRARLRRR